MTGNDIPGATGSGDATSSTSSSQANSGGRDRRNKTGVLVNGSYGTKQFAPGISCDKCSDEAVGVLVIDEETSSNGMVTVYPLCGDHARQIRESSPKWWEAQTFKEF